MKQRSYGPDFTTTGAYHVQSDFKKGSSYSISVAVVAYDDRPLERPVTDYIQFTNKSLTFYFSKILSIIISTLFLEDPLTIAFKQLCNPLFINAAILIKICLCCFYKFHFN